MVDGSHSSGWLRLKVLLLFVGIGFALTLVYIRTRPPESARIAPGAPGFGRNAARSVEAQPDGKDSRKGPP